MGTDFLIDTNSLIDFQNKVMPQNGLDYVANAIDANFIISFVTYIEFLGYVHASKALEDFISLAEIIGINKSIMDQAILIRKSSKIRLPDAIIAATAIVHNLTLISRNTKDFIHINGLQLINPYDI
jgi:predicted nucleic acid-binding protein